MAKAIFGPTKQCRPKANLFIFYIFPPTWIKFGMWTNVEQNKIKEKFEMAMAIFIPTTTNNILILWIHTKPTELF